jgi:hypothetical protein
MKEIICLLSFLATIPTFAAPSKIDLVKQNLEVKSAIASFETNRVQKCSEINESNTRIGKNGAVKAMVSCNQYNENGEPQANVYFITIRGSLYDSFFELNSVSIVGVE